MIKLKNIWFPAVLIVCALAQCAQPDVAGSDSSKASSRAQTVENPYVNEQSEPVPDPINPNRQNPCPQGFEWSIFDPVSNKEVIICCPDGQMPTGGLPGTGQQTCATPSQTPTCGGRGNPANPVTVFCQGGVGAQPWIQCCPANQQGTCAPPGSGQRMCFSPTIAPIFTDPSLQG
jgi:hypothetical protein